MKNCMKCGKKNDDDYENDDDYVNDDYCEDRAFERLKEFIEEFYEKQIQEERKNKVN